MSGELCMAALREAEGGNALSEQRPSEAGTLALGGAPEATSSAAQAADAKEAAQTHKVRCAPLSPMWVAMSQRFKENVSALKSRQGRRPSMVSRRQSLKRGPGPTQIEQPLAPWKGRVSIAGRRQSLKRDSGAHISSGSLSSQNGLPRGLLKPEPQPLPTPEVARLQKPCEEATQGETRRRSSLSRCDRQHTKGKVHQKGLQGWAAATAGQILDAVAQAPTPVAQAPASEMPPCDYCAFRNKRLRSKTPEPVDDRCQRPKRKRLSCKSSPSVESGCLPAPTGSRGRSSRSSVPGAEQQKRPAEKQDQRSRRKSEGSTSRTHIVKAYRVTWAWKLAEMGFSEDQIDVAISQCSTQREAIEWLCNS